MMMDTERINIDRLQKILSLATSDSEGEAVAAFMMAKRLMAKWGLSFGDFLSFRQGNADSSPTHRTMQELEFTILRNRIARLHEQLAEKTERLAKKEAALNQMFGIVRSINDSGEIDKNSMLN
jgi:hypothetical protein